MALKKIRRISVYDPGSPPDVDTDFATDRRDDVIEYLRQTYGRDNVSNIVTFGRMAAKQSIKSIGTIYSIPPAEVNSLTKLIPAPVEGVEMTLEDLMNPQHDRYMEAAEFRTAIASPEWQKLIQRATGIAGRVKQTGMHAGGVIISPIPLSESVPMHVREKDGEMIMATQWQYQDCESLGLIKMDLLGLDSVNILQGAMRHVLKSGKEAPNLIELTAGAMDDPAVYELFRRGDTVGIFQFGSRLVRDLLLEMQPTQFSDLAATTAIARPGPMNMQTHTKYAHRKNGREPVVPIHPAFKDSPLDEILGETYQLLCYQEQVAKIASQIAGMSLQEGDKLRKAMGKKKADVMRAMKSRFFEGAMSNGYPEEAVESLWQYIDEFSKYAFNYSHSIAYAMNAYRTAYMKAHFPAEFFSSILQEKRKDKEKYLELLKDAKIRGIVISPPDINLCDVKTAPTPGVDVPAITLGLTMVSGVGEEISRRIVEERESYGSFRSVENFVERCASFLNSSTVESLAKAGAFDSLLKNRRSIVVGAKGALDKAKKDAKKDAAIESDDLFAVFEATPVESKPMFENVTPYSHIETMAEEAEMLGTFVTSDPLDKLKSKNLGRTPSSFAAIESAARPVRNGRLLVTVGGVTKKQSRSGNTGIIVDLYDGADMINARLKPATVARFEKGAAQDIIFTAQEKMLAKKSAVKKRDVPKPLVYKNATVPGVIPYPTITVGHVYEMVYNYYPKSPEARRFTVVDLIPVTLSHNGTMPFRVRAQERNDKHKGAIIRLLKSVHSNSSDLRAVSVFTATHEGISPSSHDLGWRDRETMETVYSMIDTVAVAEKMSAQEKKKILSEYPPVLNFSGDFTDYELFHFLKYKETKYRVVMGESYDAIIDTLGMNDTWDFGLPPDIIQEDS